MQEKSTVSRCIITDRSIWKSKIMKCFSNSQLVMPTTYLSQVMIYRLLNVSLKQTEGQPSGSPTTWKKTDNQMLANMTHKTE